MNNYERTHTQHRNATRGVKYSSRNRADAKGFLFRSVKALVFKFDDRPKATSAKIGYGGAQLRISLTKAKAKTCYPTGRVCYPTPLSYPTSETRDNTSWCCYPVVIPPATRGITCYPAEGPWDNTPICYPTVPLLSRPRMRQRLYFHCN